MKYKNTKKKGPALKSKGKVSINQDSFFEGEPKKRRKIDYDEDDSESAESEDFDNDVEKADPEKSEDEEEEETADEKRKRIAMAQLEKLRELARREVEEEYEDGDEGRDDREKEGERDLVVAKILQQEQLEDSGRVKRAIASRVQKPEDSDEFRVLVKHRQSVTAIALSEDDLKGFSASKDGCILHWDVDSGKGERYVWPSAEVIKSHGAKDPQGRATKHSRHTLALAVSSDGRYLASGGLDRHIHLWDTRTREHIQAFPGHRGPVSCLTFRQGTSELFSGSFDRKVKLWNTEDRAFITEFSGHQSEILTIDCLRKERVLTAGRDRSLQLFKVPEETRCTFRGPASSLECCCFISNDEFLSGSDDGSIQLWNVVRKKPVHIVKNAHPLLVGPKNFGLDNGILTNGHLENGDQNPGSYRSSSAYSWVSSVTVCGGSDLAASGAGNGSVRVWAVESETKDVLPLYELPLVGFVNSLAFAKSGQFLVAGVGQEPRLGRWGRLSSARNGVSIHPIKLL